MARMIYGASGSAQVVSMGGTPTVAAATVKSARTGGVTVTDILNMAGQNVGGIVTPDSRGQVIFQGPEESAATLWLDFGDGGPRWAVRPVNTEEAIVKLMDAAEQADYLAPSGYTPHGAIPYVNSTISQKMAEALDKQIIPRVPSESVRDTLFPAPVDGDMCYRTDINALTAYKFGSWRAEGSSLIAEIALTADSSQVMFTNIPQDYRHLRLMYHGRAIGSPSDRNIFQTVSFRCNNDNTAGMHATMTQLVRVKNVAGGSTSYNVAGDGTGGDVGGTGTVAWKGMVNFGPYYFTTSHVGVCPGSSFNVLRAGGEMIFPNYATSSYRKAVTCISSFGDSSGYTGTGYHATSFGQGGWQSNNAITDIELFCVNATGWAAGSLFSLYGMA